MKPNARDLDMLRWIKEHDQLSDVVDEFLYENRELMDRLAILEDEMNELLEFLK